MTIKADIAKPMIAIYVSVGNEGVVDVFTDIPPSLIAEARDLYLALCEFEGEQNIDTIHQLCLDILDENQIKQLKSML